MNQGLLVMTEKKRSTTASVVLTQGSATETARIFDAGCEVAPFSVGSCGDWCIAASGVEPHHFYLCFDGRTLFAAVAAGGPTATVSDQRIAARWTRLPDGCVLNFGSASLAVTNLGDRASRPPPSSSARRAELRGPRVLDPFACETLAYARFSPPPFVRSEEPEDPTVLRRSFDTSEVTAGVGEQAEDRTVVQPVSESLKAASAAGDPPEERTVMYRPWARELALETLGRPGEEALAQTIARPVMTPMAITVSSPMPEVVARAPVPATTHPPVQNPSTGNSTLAPAAATPLLHKCIAGLIVAALVLLGVRALTRRPQVLPPKAVAVAASASAKAEAATSAARTARAVPSAERAPGAELDPPSSVNGRTPERQAVDLVARGAYREAAELYERLARVRNQPVFREAARIAERKARLAR